jgi:hypothetical protein
MTRSIRIGDIGNYCEQQVEQLLRATVLEADRRLKERSPVDTGRFRFSWQIGENSDSGTPAPPGQYRGNAAPPLAINYQAGQERLGNVYSIHNNLPYAEPLAQGHSPQAPAGWVDLVGREMQSFVASNWERIRARS